MLKKFLTLSITLAMFLVTVLSYSASTQRRKIESQGSTSQAKFHEAANAVQGKYVVMLKDDVSRSEIEPAAISLTRIYGGQIEYVYTDVFKGFSVKGMMQSQAIALSGNPMVNFVEESARAVDSETPNCGTGPIGGTLSMGTRLGYRALFLF